MKDKLWRDFCGSSSLGSRIVNDMVEMTIKSLDQNIDH